MTLSRITKGRVNSQNTHAQQPHNSQLNPRTQLQIINNKRRQQRRRPIRNNIHSGKHITEHENRIHGAAFASRDALVPGEGHGATGYDDRDVGGEDGGDGSGNDGVDYAFVEGPGGETEEGDADAGFDGEGAG